LLATTTTTSITTSTDDGNHHRAHHQIVLIEHSLAQKRVRVVQLMVVGVVGIVFGGLGNFFVSDSCYFRSIPASSSASASLSSSSSANDNDSSAADDTNNSDAFVLHLGIKSLRSSTNDVAWCGFRRMLLTPSLLSCPLSHRLRSTTNMQTAHGPCANRVTHVPLQKQIFIPQRCSPSGAST
jgi:hypothetical protein